MTVAGILSRLRPVPGSECLEWTGARNADGYGVVRPPKWMRERYGLPEIAYVHRVLYCLVRGPLADEHQGDHECRMRACGNSYHLRALDPVKHSSVSANDRWHGVRDDALPRAAEAWEPF